MTDRNQNESVSHALLALGIVLLLICSIIIAWIIVCCERCRRKRKYRPGQQRHGPDSVGGSVTGSITRSGPSPSITRHLLVPKASQHLVIANKAFLSKSTPHLIGMEEELLESGRGGYDRSQEHSWRLEGLATPTPSEPLFSSPYKVKGLMHTTPNIVSSSRPRPRPNNLNYQSDQTEVPQVVPRSRSEPLIPQLQPGTSSSISREDQGSVQELSIHDQILAILGTFPSLGFDFFIPTKSSTPLRNEVDIEAATAPATDKQGQESQTKSNGQTSSTQNDVDVEYGQESSVDGDILLGVGIEVDNDSKVTKKTPLLLPTITLNGNGLISPAKKIKPKPNPRPKTLKFLEEKRYDFVDVEVTIETEVGNDHWDEKLDKNLDLPPLLETTL